MLTARPAVFEDWARLLAWRNDESVMRWARVDARVSVLSHLDWLRRRIAAQDVTLIFRNTEVGRDVATGRLDVRPEGTELSLIVDPCFRGAGYGGVVVDELCARVPPHQRAIAYIHHHNYVSLRLFLQSGFVLDEESVAEKFLCFERARLR